MPAGRRAGQGGEYDSEAERFLDGANDDLIRALIRGIRDIERAQRWISYECQHQNRDWVRERLEAKIAELGQR